MKQKTLDGGDAPAWVAAQARAYAKAGMEWSPKHVREAIERRRRLRR